MGKDGSEETEKPIWLCGHFVAKPYKWMVDDIAESKKTDKKLVAMLWQARVAHGVAWPMVQHGAWDGTAWAAAWCTLWHGAASIML